MSWVDLIILIVVILAALRGFAEGAIRQVVGIIGFGAGFLLGTIIAPSLSTRFIHDSWRPAVALFIIVVVSVMGGIVGGYLGGLLAKVAHVLLLGLVDRIVGVVIGVVTALIFCWLAAGLLATTTWGSIASGIQHSKILSTMDDVMPPVPSIVAKVEALFPKIGLPNVFARVVAPTLPTPVNPKDLGPLVTSVSGPSSIQKVFASGACSYQSQGRRSSSPRPRPSPTPTSSRASATSPSGVSGPRSRSTTRRTISRCCACPRSMRRRSSYSLPSRRPTRG